MLKKKNEPTRQAMGEIFVKSKWPRTRTHDLLVTYRSKKRENLPVAKSHKKTYSSALVISKMQMKCTMRHHYTPTRRAKIKKTNHVEASWGYRGPAFPTATVEKGLGGSHRPDHTPSLWPNNSLLGTEWMNVLFDRNSPQERGGPGVGAGSWGAGGGKSGGGRGRGDIRHTCIRLSKLHH